MGEIAAISHRSIANGRSTELIADHGTAARPDGVGAGGAAPPVRVASGSRLGSNPDPDPDNR
jgi:hypothetical protein